MRYAMRVARYAMAIGLTAVIAEARLGYLEQLPVETFAKLREVERYQLKAARPRPTRS